MTKQQPISRTVPLALILLTGILHGCAGGWVLVNPELSEKNQGRVVEVVEMNDGQVVFFDPFDSTGPGPDTRARLYGETIEGNVNNVPRIIHLEDVKKVQFGVDSKEVKRASPYVIGGVVFVVLLVPILYLIAMTNVDMR